MEKKEPTVEEAEKIVRRIEEGMREEDVPTYYSRPKVEIAYCRRRYDVKCWVDNDMEQQVAHGDFDSHYYHIKINGGGYWLRPEFKNDTMRGLLLEYLADRKKEYLSNKEISEKTA